MAKQMGNHFLSPVNEEKLISRIHELLYAKHYNQKSMEVLLVNEFQITYEVYRAAFRKVADRMKQNANELLDLAGEKIMTVLFKLMEDDNPAVQLKAIESMMKLMDINTKGLYTHQLKNETYAKETVKFEFTEVEVVEVKND